MKTDAQKLLSRASSMQLVAWLSFGIAILLVIIGTMKAVSANPDHVQVQPVWLVIAGSLLSVGVVLHFFAQMLLIRAALEK
jgi:hypothetical protein